MHIDRVVYAPDGRPAARLDGPLYDAARYAMAHGLHVVMWGLPSCGEALATCLEKLTATDVSAAIETIAIRHDVRRRWGQPRVAVDVFSFADEQSLSRFRKWRDAA